MTHEEKVQFVLENYSSMTAEEIASIVGLHRNSVQRIAWRNNINKKTITKDLPGEEWFEIKGYSRYLISNFSRVKRKRDNALIGTTYTVDYYHSIKLVNDEGKRKTTRLHRLVAETFIPNPDNKPEVNHIDGNKDNNLKENLEWVTGGENQKHSYKHKLRKPANIDYQESLVVKVCELLEKGLSNPEIAKEIEGKMNLEQIRRIKNRKTWISISKDYDF